MHWLGPGRDISHHPKPPESPTCMLWHLTLLLIQAARLIRYRCLHSQAIYSLLLLFPSIGFLNVWAATVTELLSFSFIRFLGIQTRY
ncbi:hypothetical protein L6164_031183 [Bauhinia variegata]|uniref:Uncharacterized protein n=1 Tax=Bauhinia variegata TaxID=167791 RepID=A0ACB9LEU9_BAUVA|nr:hypothetical protein L6164_031183 [Bauhinia variegata]